MRVAALVFAAVLFVPAAGAAQSEPEASPVRLIVSSSPMTRNADLLLAGSVLATTGTDALLEKAWPGTLRDNGSKGRLVRGAKLALLDLPVVLYAAGLNHELGHITRANEKGYRSELTFKGTPWSVTPFDLRALDWGIFEDLGSQVGGEEASLRLKDRAESAMRSTGRIAAGHALAVIAASLDLPLYAYWNLARDKFDNADGRFPDGDLGMFVRLLVDRRENARFDATRGAVRMRSMLNLLDGALWTLSFGVVRDHVWRGEDGVPVRWIPVAGAAFIPSVRYAITPIGPEYAIRSHYRVSAYSGLGYVRWSERVGDARQVGVGLSLAGQRLRGVEPKLAADVWSHTTQGAGLHASAGLEFVEWPSRRAALTLMLGAKSAGYLSGFPLDRGAYVEAGFVVKPW